MGLNLESWSDLELWIALALVIISWIVMSYYITKGE